MGIIRRLAAPERQGSLSNRFRSSRFTYFTDLMDRLERPVSLLDVGGTVRFWERRGWLNRRDVHITLLKLETEEVNVTNIVSAAGDATDLGRYADGQFDVLFSNSVIEHLFTFEKQTAMARETERVGRS